MNSPIDVSEARPRPRHATGDEPEAGLHPEQPMFDPYTGERLRDELPDHERISEMFQGVPPPIVEDVAPVNPYAPTGWKRKHRIEFDQRLPSGQLVRIVRLEREDLFRLNLMQYLDTFTPMLLENATASEAEQQKRIQDTMKEKPDAMANMFMAIDEVVQAAAVKPKITTDENLVDYGTPTDWANPKFIPVALMSDIPMEDRMVMFGAAFGKSMDDLKSVWGETPGMGGLADVPVVQPVAEPDL